jgi:hypothetical protein
MSYERLMEIIPEREGDFEPCFAFSVHESGSSLMHSMIGLACAAAGIPAVTVPDIMFDMGEVDGSWETDPAMLDLFCKRKLFYGFRNYPSVLSNPEALIRERRFVLLVRDPRDALVSQYFSLGRKKSSHAVPKENPDAFRTQIDMLEDTEIEEYVLHAAPDLLRKLTDYRDHLNYDLGMKRRYEDIYFDKRTFLADIFDHFGMDVNGLVAQSLPGIHIASPAT